MIGARITSNLKFILASGDKASSAGLYEMYWWLRHDWVTYKVPVEDGRVLIPQVYLEPGFTLSPEELRYSFLGGKRDTRIVADFAGWSSAAFFVSQRGFKVFEAMFARHGRSYPVACSGQQYYIVLIDTLIDAFDDERSKVERSDLEPNLREDISRFLHIVLRPGFSTAADIFRLDGSYALWTNIIVSDRFKQLYEKSGLTGLFFEDTTPVLH